MTNLFSRFTLVIQQSRLFGVEVLGSTVTVRRRWHQATFCAQEMEEGGQERPARGDWLDNSYG